MAALSEQIEAFKAILPDIRREHGSAWAVLVDRQVKGAFPDFERAASFAIERFPDDEVLIRHTDETQETVPFMVVER